MTGEASRTTVCPGSDVQCQTGAARLGPWEPWKRGRGHPWSAVALEPGMPAGGHEGAPEAAGRPRNRPGSTATGSFREAGGRGFGQAGWSDDWTLEAHPKLV